MVQEKDARTTRLRMLQITPGKEFAELNNARRGDDQLLLLRWQIESFEVNEGRVGCGDGSQVRRDVDVVETLFIGRRLLTDMPFQ